MLQAAIDAEVEAFIAMHADRTDERAGGWSSRTEAFPSERSSPVLARSPSRRGECGTIDPDPESPSSRSLRACCPAYLRKTKAIEELIPWLYLKGISTGDFGEALQSLVGERAAGLSANVVCPAEGAMVPTSTTSGASGICPANSTFTSGPTAFTRRSDWRTMPTKSSVCWC